MIMTIMLLLVILMYFCVICKPVFQIVKGVFKMLLVFLKKAGKNLKEILRESSDYKSEHKNDVQYSCTIDWNSPIFIDRKGVVIKRTDFPGADNVVSREVFILFMDDTNRLILQNCNRYGVRIQGRPMPRYETICISDYLTQTGCTFMIELQCNFRYRSYRVHFDSP